MSKALYIAGPMSGIPEFNYPAFNLAEEDFSPYYARVFNPAKNPFASTISYSMSTGNTNEAVKNEGLDMRAAYLWDIERVIQSDAIYMLKGWEKGAGARGEHAVACVIKRHYPEYEIIYE